jgi:hypothetical protein
VEETQLNDLAIGGATSGIAIKPYTNQNRSYSCRWNVDPFDISDYGHDSIVPKIYVRGGSGEGEPQDATFGDASNDSTLNFTLSPDNLFKAMPDGLDRDGRNEVELVLQLENVFGDIAETSVSFIADFDETDSVTVLREGEQQSKLLFAGYEPNQWEYLLEEMAITGNVYFKSYNEIKSVKCSCGPLEFSLETSQSVPKPSYNSPVIYKWVPP